MQFTKSLAAFTLSAALLGAGAAAANAATEYPEGGTFDYGTDSPTRGTWSDYHHPSRAHHTRAGNASYFQNSGVASPGRWAQAQVGTTLWGNYALYNFD
ncbi:lactococcin 972 family bacteriocin [Plantibacter sp. YIM 135249]|uniref:lactococcin 972 family bacteriocin n=1 Tax=Plantibacter sp. YIM 135249 TaxID=3423918 RepID=UPI003D3407FC